MEIPLFKEREIHVFLYYLYVSSMHVCFCNLAWIHYMSFLWSESLRCDPAIFTISDRLLTPVKSEERDNQHEATTFLKSGFIHDDII